MDKQTAIDWSAAPEWAAYLVMDPYGSWYAEEEPVLIYADPPYFQLRGNWQRISYASRNAKVIRRPGAIPTSHNRERTIDEIQKKARAHIDALEAATHWSSTSRRFKEALLAGIAALRAAPAAAGLPELQRRIDELDASETQLIRERDHAYEIIDRLCDAVLGPDRNEWSSAYYFEDAVEEVEDTVAALRAALEQRAVPEDVRSDAWLPIETAPKDGKTRILLWERGDAFIGLRPIDCPDDAACDALGTACYPSHYMPLPNPPAPQPQGEEVR